MAVRFFLRNAIDVGLPNRAFWRSATERNAPKGRIRNPSKTLDTTDIIFRNVHAQGMVHVCI